jgi:hypothetical protein
LSPLVFHWYFGRLYQYLDKNDDKIIIRVNGSVIPLNIEKSFARLSFAPSGRIMGDVHRIYRCPIMPNSRPNSARK